MALYTDSILVLSGGKIQKISASDSLAITGSITAAGFSGSGANLTSIPQSAVTSLTTDLGTLTSDVASAQADATQALADAATADGKAVAAQADATQALADAATADGKAVAAQADATQALADAADAQADATQALADAATADGKAVAAQADATQALSDAADAQATADAALPKAGGTLTGPLIGTDATFSGDLVVEGSIVSKSQENVLISDSFLDLNAGNTITASATAGGLTVNVKASGAAESVSAFVAGVVATSAPSFTTTAASGFAAGDIIQISGAAEAKNNGLFVVAGVSGSTVEIKGIGGTAVSVNTPFVQNDFVTASAQSATATKADIAVLAVSNGSLTKSGAVAIAAGVWCFNYQTSASDSEFAATWSEITASSVPTLAQVLTAGSMIGADNEIGFVINVAGAAVKGDLLYVGSDGEAKLISTAIAGGELEAVALEAGGSSKEVASVVGQKIWVGVTGAAPAVGDLLYVSATAGKGVVAAPTSGRLIKVGKCVGAVGSGANSGLYPVLFQPQYLADL